MRHSTLKPKLLTGLGTGTFMLVISMGAASAQNMAGAYAGPDLSGEGLTQCYGWHNDGATAPPTRAQISTACGAGERITFAGHRADGSFVRHDMTLRSPFSNYLNNTAYFQDFDVDSNYSWRQNSNWILLVSYGNAWSDPGRLWEPGINGQSGATGGHVLSQAGNNGYDQHSFTGDKYYIYVGNPDADGDGVANEVDNCPNTANANQADGDVDGIGDACDLCPSDATNDADGDGVCQDVDNCPTIANGDQADDNGDGFGDACVSPDANIGGNVIFEGDAVIGSNAVIGNYSRIGAGATVNGSIGDAVAIGAGATVGAGTTVGNATRLGAGTNLGGNCVVGSRVVFGSNVTTGANCVIGDRAVIESEASLAANVTVGRGANVGLATQIGLGTILGDNVSVGANGQIGGGSDLGANSRVGADFVFGANVVFEGNVVVGDNADFAEDTIFGGYAVVGNGVTIGARSELASGASVSSGAIVGTDTEIRGQIGADVVLGDNVFIGNQSVVSADATLDNNVTLGIFAAVGQRTAIGPDTAIYDGVVIGNDGDIAARNTILFRTTIGDRATINTDTLIDEQITIGDDFTLGANSRLWPFSTFGDGVTIGANVLVRDTADINSEVTIEDNVLIYPETTLSEGAIIRAGVTLGAGNCSGAGCGNVSVGGCQEVNADLDPFAIIEGTCQRGLEPATAGLDCLDLLENGNVNADGTYWIDPDGAGAGAPFQAYCDMTSSGGGWTLVLNLDTSDGHVMWWHNSLWTNSSLHNDASPDLSGDYKGAGWNELPAQEMLLLVHEQGAYKGWKAFDSANAGNTMFNWLNAGTNVPITTNGATDTYLAPDLWAGEHLVRDSSRIWINQNDNFNGYCNTNDWDRICSDTCKRGGNDGGGLGNCHDCSHGPQWRTTSEAQAGWHNWTSNSGCYAGTPHNGLGHFGSDTAYPATCNNSGANNTASWSCSNNIEYDYAIFVR